MGASIGAAKAGTDGTLQHRSWAFIYPVLKGRSLSKLSLHLTLTTHLFSSSSPFYSTLVSVFFTIQLIPHSILTLYRFKRASGNRSSTAHLQVKVIEYDG